MKTESIAPSAFTTRVAIAVPASGGCLRTARRTAVETRNGGPPEGHIVGNTA